MGRTDAAGTDAAGMRAAPGAAGGDGPHPDESVGPLERGLAVLRALAVAPEGRRRASELTRITGLARSTVDRLAATLIELGYLRAEGDGRELLLAPGAAGPGAAYLRGSGLPAALTAAAAELSARLDESVSLAVPDRESVRFVVQCRRRRALSVAFGVGDALPAERCAPGALFAQTWTGQDFAAWRRRLEADPDHASYPALPAHHPRHESVAGFARRIEDARRDGWAADDQLIEEGLIAIAVPVREAATGAIVCALSVVSHSSRQSVDTLRSVALGPMRETADEMTRRLAAYHATRHAVPAIDRRASGDARKAAPQPQAPQPQAMQPAQPQPMRPMQPQRPPRSGGARSTSSPSPGASGCSNRSARARRA